MRSWIVAMAIVMLALPQMVFALSLSEAKTKGLVGETPSGYLAAVQSDAEAAAIVDSTNAARRAEYERIAAANKQDRAAVEALAAKKAYEMTPAGQYVQGADGAWKKK
jgi:uncharacterized protein YdbL (DUF1318 family)